MQLRQLLVVVGMLVVGAVETYGQPSVWSDPDATNSITVESIRSFLSVDTEQFTASASIVSGRYQLPSGAYILADVPMITTQHGSLLLRGPDPQQWQAGDSEFNLGNISIGTQFDPSENVSVIFMGMLPTATYDAQTEFSPGLTTDPWRLNFAAQDVMAFSLLTQLNRQINPHFSFITRLGLHAPIHLGNSKQAELFMNLEPALQYKLGSFGLLAGTSLMTRVLGKEISYSDRIMHSVNLALQVDGDWMFGSVSLRLPTTNNLEPLNAILGLSVGIRF